MIPYFPAEGGGFRLSLGLKVLDPADWIEIDGNHESELAQKRALLTDRQNDVFQALEGSQSAQADLMANLQQHLLIHHADRFRPDGASVRNLTTGDTISVDPLSPLRSAARLVQEDILLLQPSSEGHRLIAALLCFPTRWKLADKLGNVLSAIHDPVPGYAEKLARPMDRLFAGLTPERWLWRQNFSLLDDPALFQPGGHFKQGAGKDLSPHTIGEQLWFRVERQTVRLLPETGTTVFTVRIHQARLSEVVHNSSRAADLISTIDAMPEEMKRYKSLPGFEKALRAWLEERIG
ncbi:heme-dependent oxidative N-demethylase family protein [Minwuia sp.]|uniref:heme-dependent oxidative N-demethylase family protein n=1 Tax=Minwuia sp. TaxID=2493630 RepID=UPI003A91E821